MKIRQVYDALESLAEWNDSHIDQAARRLREMRMLPVGGRGPAAPDIDYEHVSTLLLALAATDRATDAAFKVTVYAPLQPAEGNAATHGFAAAPNAGEALTTLLQLQAEHEDDAIIRELRVCRSWPLVIFEHHDGRIWNYGYIDIKTAKDAGFQTYPVRVECRIPGYALQQLVLDVSEPAGADD